MHRRSGGIGHSSGAGLGHTSDILPDHIGATLPIACKNDFNDFWLIPLAEHAVVYMLWLDKLHGDMPPHGPRKTTKANLHASTKVCST